MARTLKYLQIPANFQSLLPISEIVGNTIFGRLTACSVLQDEPKLFQLVPWHSINY